MANYTKDHTSIRVHAPPGGQSSNIFGSSETDQSAANKKRQQESDIFGVKKDNNDAAPVKQNRNTGNNIFGTDAQDTQPKAPGTIAGQYKQTQMKSNIFGNDEPTSARAASDKNRSNIFGVGDDDQNKRQSGNVRQGLRVGYNPINGEAYTPKDNNTTAKPTENAKPAEEQNTNTEPKTASTENNDTQATPATNTENGNTQATPTTTNTSENGNTQTKTNNANEQKTDNNPINGNNAQKNVHTSVRVFHPPGGKSNGPLW